ncbi:MAG: NAD(P)-binding protein, partial [Gammaproteobacteria bacterium]|nr:NAD(P)-binding protein [Gammaproteobacteria bacterium]
MQSVKILIAGGGIGGLTAALCLQRAGYEVQIFEQAPELFETGAGLQCGANAVRVLDYLGLMPMLAEVAVQPLRADFREYCSGEVLYSTSFGESYVKKFGAPYLH